MTILDQKVVHRNGPHVRLKRWIMGWVHGVPNGKFIWGYTGPETEQEVEAFMPLNTFTVMIAKEPPK